MLPPSDIDDGDEVIDDEPPLTITRDHFIQTVPSIIQFMQTMDVETLRVCNQLQTLVEHVESQMISAAHVHTEIPSYFRRASSPV